ncbi:MAG: ADP-glyceromanno-heptose 6-epimerase [Elusimicrobiota bacterium]|jgi:ADP-L-glycero-D-manno-heptose 6-epimerase|nr:ADP-glyceromanno-heptose 6-epimerase [Elusimicrobiota bacterium]
MTQKKYLITGGAGFVGSNLAFELEKQGHSVTIVDNFSSGHFKNLIGFKGDIVAADVFDELPQDDYFDAIFHEAAITDTDIHDQKLMMEKNVEAFRNVLYYAAANEIKKVIYASSAAVYGNGDCPMNVAQPAKPENIYGFSKAIMDNVAREFVCDNRDMVIVGLRYFNVYGPGEYYKGKTASMMYQLYNQMIKGYNPKIFKMGEQERDFVYIKDVVKANMCALNNAKESCVVNVGTGIPRNFNDVIKCLNKELGTKLATEYIENPFSFYQLKTQADILLTTEKIGYKPDYTLEAGIEDYVKVLNARNAKATVKK